MTVPAWLVWFGFALLLILATAPVWRLVVFGLSPTLDDLLAVICSSAPSAPHDRWQWT